MHPVNAKLKLVVQSDVINFGLDIHLPMDALVHAAQVILCSRERRWTIRHLKDACGHVDGHLLLSYRCEDESQFIFQFLPEINLVIGFQVHRRTALAGAACTPAAAARGAATSLAAPATPASAATARGRVKRG